MKYWDHNNMPLLYCLAIILNPIVKLNGLYNGLTHIAEHMNVDFASTYSLTFNNTKCKLFEIFASYQNKFGQQVNTETEETLPTAGDRKKKKVLGFFSTPARSGSSSSSSVTRPLSASSTTRSTTHSELKKYLDTDFSLLDSTTNNEDFNILDWWRLQSTNFPVLSRLARDVLTIPVSTVSSESAFSTAGRIIEDRRTSLTPEMVEVLTCLKDWEHADKRLQYTVEDQEILQHFNEMAIIDDDDIDNAPAAPSSGC